MEPDVKKLIDIVNKSGFPFQIAVANYIKTLETEQKWHVVYAEHSWKNADDGGFIDLVIQNKTKSQVLVVECKRDSNDMPWIFFNSEMTVSDRRHAKLYFNYTNVNRIIEA